MKGSVEQVMRALNNLLAMQDEDLKASLKETYKAKTIGTSVDPNPSLGFIPGFKPTLANITLQ